MTTATIIAALNANLLHAAGVEKAERNLALTRADSPYRAEFEAEVVEVKARWAAETELRECRETLRRAFGLSRKEDRRGNAYWVAKVNGAWISTEAGRGLSVEQFAAKLAR